MAMSISSPYSLFTSSSPSCFFYLTLHLVVDLRPQKKNKLIINRNVERFTQFERIIQDAVRCYREICEGKKKQSSSGSSSRKHPLPQPKNMTLICTVQYR
jgi:hypothetical protein